MFRPETCSHDMHESAPAVVNLHLDARLGRPYSAATVLVYLNDIEFGGGTVFPCIGADADCKAAFEKTFEQGLDFIDSAPKAERGLREQGLLAAADTLARCGDVPGFVTKPRRGSAIAFWTINPHGPLSEPWSAWTREPLAWHGGVRVFPGGAGKWVLQKFKDSL
eukprot:TRINITY_DN32563_c0_g1_i1.p1 TRINITY_DN32563_c0_g1~~TRINITY_DN32563_c0_g1_i1.p1  ORF type:complete len:165 (-),score=38.74 TRINITY_DN32563_c0_g1_i1:76-570(-)